MNEDVIEIDENGTVRSLGPRSAADHDAITPTRARLEQEPPFDDWADHIASERENFGYDNYVAMIEEGLRKAYREGQAASLAALEGAQHRIRELEAELRRMLILNGKAALALAAIVPTDIGPPVIGLEEAVERVTRAKEAAEARLDAALQYAQHLPNGCELNFPSMRWDAKYKQFRPMRETDGDPKCTCGLAILLGEGQP